MLHYHYFWPTFYNDPKRIFQQAFERVFADIPIPREKEVHIYTVFNGGCELPAKAPNEIRISYSGEVFNLDPQLFDINLIMKTDDVKLRTVCFPLFIVESYVRNYWPLYMSPRPFTPKTNFCAFVVSNGKALTRLRFFQLLSKYKRVDSYGSVFHNTDIVPPAREDSENYLSFLGKHKFMICFENNSNDWYMTEKLHNAWLAGTIPIYWGCTSAPKWLNPRAFLYLQNDSMESMVNLVQQIIYLDTNDNAYMSMYNEPLVLNDYIPDDLNIEKIREKVRQLLR